jgi:hypothetical protein
VLLTQLAAFTLVKGNFCPLSLFFYRVDASATASRDETPVPSFLYTEALSAEVENLLHGKICSFYVFRVYLSVLCSISIIYNTKLCVHTYIV